MADEHQEIGELLSRHATLQATNRDLRAHKSRCDGAAEALRAELAAYAKARGDELLLLNNRLAGLKQKLEGHEQEAALLEASKDGALAAAGRRALVYGQVVLATDNLFSQCRQRSHIAAAAAAGPLQQLEVIGNYVSDLGAACRQAGAVAGAQPAAAGGAGGAEPAAAATAAAAIGQAAAAVAAGQAAAGGQQLHAQMSQSQLSQARMSQAP